MGQQAKPEWKDLTLAVFNHLSWSTLHVASRYLQVYAEPIAFDGQGLLSSTKGFSAVFLFSIGVVNSRWVDRRRSIGSPPVVGDDVDAARNYDDTGVGGSASPAPVPSSSMIAASSETAASCVGDTNRNNASVEKPESVEEDATSSHGDDPVIRPRQQQHQDESVSFVTSQTSSPKANENCCAMMDGDEPSRRKEVMFYTFLFAFVSTTRACSNIASSGYTYPHNIALIANMSPVVTALFDRIFLRSPFPPLLWPMAIISVLGGSLIAISQSFGGDNSSERGKVVSPGDNLTGCSLQLLAVVFSSLSRILTKKTEYILTPTHIVQTNNVSNCIIPFAITMIRNPSSWYAFRYLPFAAPKSLVAWCTVSIGVYSFASILQIRLVRKLGPGLYSSWASFRTLGTMVLSASILGEGISGLLEWLGVGLLVASMSVYLGETRKWLDRKGSEKLGDDDAWGEGTEDDGDEELVPIGREKRPLLAGDAGK